jgi:hypothetical protein
MQSTLQLGVQTRANDLEERIISIGYSKHTRNSIGYSKHTWKAAMAMVQQAAMAMVQQAAMAMVQQAAMAMVQQAAIVQLACRYIHPHNYSPLDT